MSLVEEIRLLVESSGAWAVQTGTVTQASPLLVRLPPTTEGMPTAKLASYSPVVGDQVLVLVAATARFVLGAIA